MTAISNQMVMFGGQSLEDSADLNDLYFLRKVLLPLSLRLLITFVLQQKSLNNILVIQHITAC